MTLPKRRAGTDDHGTATPRLHAQNHGCRCERHCSTQLLDDEHPWMLHHAALWTHRSCTRWCVHRPPRTLRQVLHNTQAINLPERTRLGPACSSTMLRTLRLSPSVNCCPLTPSISIYSELTPFLTPESVRNASSLAFTSSNQEFAAGHCGVQQIRRDTTTQRGHQAQN